MSEQSQPRKMFELGVMVEDKASGLKGCLNNMRIQGSNHNRFYYFQPALLNTEDGSPANREWITADRIIGNEIDEPPLPYEALATVARDKITGFEGMVTGITLHINGCVHLLLQPKGSNKKTGSVLESHDFDIRVLEGKAIPKLTKEEKAASIAQHPSPSGYKPLKLR